MSEKAVGLRILKSFKKGDIVPLDHSTIYETVYEPRTALEELGILARESAARRGWGPTDRHKVEEWIAEIDEQLKKGK